MQNNIEVLLSDPRCMPNRAHETDAGADLISTKGYILQGKSSSDLIDTGVAVKIPTGYVGLVFSRSGMGLKGVRLANSVGVIDSDYRGNIFVKLVNDSNEAYIIEPYKTKIAQLVIVPILLANFTTDVNEWDDTKRSKKGFGSTGA